jgi:hypothetical protein
VIAKSGNNPPVDKVFIWRYNTYIDTKEHTMAKLLISTQVYENYGAHDWEGEGECPQYWKAKGGSDYVVKKFKGDVTTAVMCLRSQIECDNEHIKENIIGFELVADDYLTEFEQSQLDYEGQIRYPAKELAW